MDTQTIPLAYQGEYKSPKELAGDGMKDEHDGCRYCLGCPVCESELEDEI